MHLAYVTAALPFSLEETYIVPEIEELQRRGHRVTVVPTRPGRLILHDDARLLAGFTIAERVLSLSVVGGALAEAMRSPRLVLRCALLIATSRNIRVLLKNLLVFPKGLWLARIARKEVIDHVHAHFASTSATVALVASVVSGIPFSFTAHRWDITENNLIDKKAQKAKFARAIDIRGGKELAFLAGEYQQKVRIIHMGVEFHPPDREEDEKLRKPLRVVLGARLDEFKGHDYALKAVASLKLAGVAVMLDCAGEGPLRAAFEDYANTLGISDCVVFTGLLDHQELLKRLRHRHWDVAILPSIETRESWEGIPVFLMEAMAAGIPVIATNTGGIAELLHDGAGVLIPERDTMAIADALSQLATDGKLRRQLADACVRRVRDQFTIGSTVSSLLDEISS